MMQAGKKFHKRSEKKYKNLFVREKTALRTYYTVTGITFALPGVPGEMVKQKVWDGIY